MTKMILPIYPEYIDLIIKGKKKYDFRNLLVKKKLKQSSYMQHIQ